MNTALTIIQEGDGVLLYQDQRRQWVTTVSRERFHTHKGYVDLGQLIGRSYGGTVESSMGQRFMVFKPRITDIIGAFDRPTQILYPKDVGYALYQLGLRHGSRVVEVGTGSGAMTASLAQAVWPDGHVYTYEIRPEFVKVAKKNLSLTGLSDVVTLHNKDPSEGFDEDNVEAAVVDLGDPWKMAEPAWKALLPGGMLASFTPTTNQLEKLSVALKEAGFLVLETVEILLRSMRAEAGKLRPETRMIGHTAYTTIARKVSSNQEPSA